MNPQDPFAPKPEDSLSRLTDLLIYSNDGPAEARSISENQDRILQVIKARWVCLGLLALYGVFIHILYRAETSVELELGQQVIPLLTLGFVVAYNAWYQFSFRWWRRLRFTNLLQLTCDMLVVTLLVHFSGGVHSWFWAMYMLLTLEAVFLLRWRGLCVTGVLGSWLYGGLLTAEYYGVISPVPMPFEDGSLAHAFTYELITWGWVSVMNASVALIGTYLMSIVREREAQLAVSLKLLEEKQAIIDRDLQRARQIQGSLLPLDELPPRVHMSIGARMIPAREIGGDYYDYFVTKDDRLYVSIGDVSGKGVQAGLTMAIARTILRSLVSRYREAADIVVQLNRKLKSDMRPGQFMSFLLLAKLSPSSDKMLCAGAGHERIIIFRYEERRCEILSTGGLVLGVMDDLAPHLSLQEITLGPRDFLVLYSDGVTEAEDPEGKFFGMTRLIEAVQAVGAEPHGCPRALVGSLLERVDAFRQGRDLHDDVTLLVFGPALDETKQGEGAR